MSATPVRELELPPHRLGAFLGLPHEPQGIVIFAHGSGSSRFSPRNAFVARALERSGFATLLFDLLTPAEAIDRRRVFDIPLLAQRLLEAIQFVRAHPPVRSLPIGLFGASTGAAAALVAAAELPQEVAAVVSRGGRPDLAGAALSRVMAPTLLVVGERDETVLELNRLAMRQMICEVRLEIVPGATHLFEEPGTLEQVVSLATDWFRRYLRPTAGSSREK
ncbi:Putative phosphoribosyl transferase [bacterium HR40]|nr:Putative phosphoribosyl transferase [bacterium HR40]